MNEAVLTPSRSVLSKYKKPLAIGISLGLHALLFLALGITTHSHLANATLKGEGTSEVEGIHLDLVGVHDSAKAVAQASPPPPKPTAPKPTAMDAFMQMTEPPPPTTAPSTAKPSLTKSLSQVFGENPFQPQPPAQNSAKSAPESKTSTEAHVKLNDSNNKTTANDLWKTIAPCWKRIADKNTQAVALEVSFSPLGNLSKPPVIKRNPGNHINDQMLRSEAQAISALSQCGPYLMAYGQENVTVAFPAGG